MAGDGVSLPTTIAQMGSVAKAQAKAQQPAQQATPFSEQLDKKDELKAQRIRQVKETEQQKIKPDEDGKDRRQRRKWKRQLKRTAREQGSDSGQEEDLPSEDSGEEQERLGGLVDLRV